MELESTNPTADTSQQMAEQREDRNPSVKSMVSKWEEESRGMSTVSAATIATQITEQAQQPAGPIQIDPVEKAEILANQAPIALLAEHEDEAEEARQQIAQVNLLQEEEVKQISSVSTEDISTSNLKSYLERELGNLENDEMEIYNVLQCPVGDIQGDEQEITNQLERTYTASIIELSLDNTRQRLPTFDSQINKVIQVLACTNKGVFLTSLAPSPDGNPASQKIKQVSKIYDKRVKFMQLYKKILFIVGSELMEDEKETDFSPN